MPQIAEFVPRRCDSVCDILNWGQRWRKKTLTLHSSSCFSRAFWVQELLSQQVLEGFQFPPPGLWNVSGFSIAQFSVNTVGAQDVAVASGGRAGFGFGGAFLAPTAPHLVFQGRRAKLSVLDGFRVSSFFRPAGVDVSQTKKKIQTLPAEPGLHPAHISCSYFPGQCGMLVTTRHLHVK